MDPDELTPEEWKKRLTREQYHILRDKGTEPAYSGEYYQLKEAGVYRCAGCGEILFDSRSKYDSGSGWPSFWEPYHEESLDYATDHRIPLMSRTEVMCKRCHSHLGHVFEDGPAPTGQRYCINSLALHFEPKSDNDKKAD